MPIYWAGARKGYRYQFRRAGDSSVYVRYLRRGFPAGPTDGTSLLVATYPFSGAFDAVKKAADGKAKVGPRGSIYFEIPAFHRAGLGRHILMAFPGVDYEIEIYDPDRTVPPAIASSGRVRSVTG